VAHKKAGGSTSLGRDSVSKRLGVKVFGGQKVTAGGIIVRQKGERYEAGENVGVGNDYTIYAAKSGEVKFAKKAIKSFSGSKKEKTVVNVIAEEK
jgi:large subunit ribosomal protein L27